MKIPAYRLRPPTRSDVQPYGQFLSDKNISIWLEDACQKPLSETAIEDFILRSGWCHWAIEYDGQFCGLTGLDDPDLSRGQARFFIVLGMTDLWDQGMGTAVTQQVLDYGFKVLQLRKIVSDYLETNIASLEEGVGAAAYGSGMAAISAILTLLKSGEHIISNYNVYGGTFRLIDKILLNMGIKVLFIYPNTFGMNMLPPAIALFSAILKQKGHDVSLFDATYYSIDYGLDSDGTKAARLNVVPFETESLGIKMRETDWREDLDSQINSFNPDLIALSTTEDMWNLGLKMLEHIKGYISRNKVPVLAGGVFPTFAPEIVIREPIIDMVCVGEGENAIVDLADKISRGENYYNVTN